MTTRPIKDWADPIEGWLTNDFLQKAPRTKHDLYISLALYIEDIFLQFCWSIASLEISFGLLDVNASDSSAFLKLCGKARNYFDVIDIIDV